MSLTLTNLSEAELNANEDKILEDIAAMLGVPAEHVSLDHVQVNSDGTLTFSVVGPSNVDIPEDFEEQVESILNAISGLEDVTVEGKYHRIFF